MRAWAGMRRADCFFPSPGGCSSSPAPSSRRFTARAYRFSRRWAVQRQRFCSGFLLADRHLGPVREKAKKNPCLMENRHPYYYRARWPGAPASVLHRNLLASPAFLFDRTQLERSPFRLRVRTLADRGESLPAGSGRVIRLARHRLPPLLPAF